MRDFEKTRLVPAMMLLCVFMALLKPDLVAEGKAKAPVAPAAAATSQVTVSAEKQVLSLAHTNQILSTKQIVAQTTLELDEAEEVLKKLVSKGLAKELVEPNGSIKYDFS